MGAFKLEESADLERDEDEKVLYLKPVTPPTTSGQSLERKKKFVPAPFWGPFFFPYYAATMAYTWTAFEAMHAKLNKLLHSLEDDVHQLSHANHGKSMERKE